MPSETLPALLESVADAIRAGDLDTAQNRLDEVETVYDELDVSERRQQRAATVGRDSTETPSDVREQLDEFAQAVNASDLARSSMLVAATIHLAAPSQSDPEEIAGTLDEQAGHEASLVDLEDAVEDALDDVTLPPLTLVADVEMPSGVQPKGSAFDVPVTVENVGDAPASDVVLSQDSEADVSPRTDSIGTLGPGSSATGTFVVPADSTGEFALTLRAEGDPGRADERTERFQVVDKTTAIENARGAIADLIEYVDESEELTGGRETAALSELENAASKLEDAARFTSQDRARQANEMLDAAARIVGAFLNYVDGLTNGDARGNGKGNGDGLSDSFARTLMTLGEGVVDQLSLAKDADV